MAIKSFLFIVTTVLGLIFISSIESASAMPLNYEEAIDGEISGSLLEPTFNLDIGTNTVAGNTGKFGTGQFDIDFDYFRFTLPSGSQLNSVSYEFTNVVLLPGTSHLSMRYFLVDEASSDFDVFDVNILNDTSPLSFFAAFLPLGEGSYQISNSLSSTAGAGGTWDYTLSFNVSAVPVPPAVWLFVTALVGLIGFGKRRNGIQIF